jgi:hypothetical protein
MNRIISYPGSIISDYACKVGEGVDGRHFGGIAFYPYLRMVDALKSEWRRHISDGDSSLYTAKEAQDRGKEALASEVLARCEDYTKYCKHGGNASHYSPQVAKACAQFGLFNLKDVLKRANFNDRLADRP